MQVREQLRNAIVDTRFKPGQRLVERELCELVGVSRTVIREALRELESDGLVRIVPNKGPVVAGPMSVEDARSLYETRAVLEALAGRSFAERATDEERRALRVAFAAIEDATRRRESDPIVILHAKAQFYAVLLAGARNETLSGVLRSLRDRINSLRALTVVQPGRATESLKEIRQIVRAVEARDPGAAWTACLAHVQCAGAVALGILTREQAGGTEPADERGDTRSRAVGPRRARS